MLRRFVAATALGGFAIALVLVIDAAAQTNYKVPRLPDGHPDFQGFWNNTTYTPLERPKGIDRQFFTKEEVVEHGCPPFGSLDRLGASRIMRTNSKVEGKHMRRDADDQGDQPYGTPHNREPGIIRLMQSSA